MSLKDLVSMTKHGKLKWEAYELEYDFHRYLAFIKEKGENQIHFSFVWYPYEQEDKRYRVHVWDYIDKFSLIDEYMSLIEGGKLKKLIEVNL